VEVARPRLRGKMAVEAVDRAMRGQTSPRQSMRRGRSYRLAARRTGWPLRGAASGAGEARLAILDSYTKEHSAEYQAQAWIDLARRMGTRTRPFAIRRTSPRSFCTRVTTPQCDRLGRERSSKVRPHGEPRTWTTRFRTFFAVALQDGAWDHNSSYSPERAGRPDTVQLWHKITTADDPEWTVATTRSIRTRRRLAAGSRSRRPTAAG